MQENLTGREVIVPRNPGGRVEKNHLIAREDEDIFSGKTQGGYSKGELSSQ